MDGLSSRVKNNLKPFIHMMNRLMALKRDNGNKGIL